MIEEAIQIHGGKPFGDDAKRRIGQLRALSKSWLKKAWRGKESLGPNSRIFAKAQEHLERVNSYCPPSDAEMLGNYIETVELAWHACWRALDFTISGFEKHSPGLSSFLISRGFRAQMSDPTGAKWYPFAFPKIDENGDPLSGSPDQNAVENMLLAIKQGFKPVPGMIVDARWRFYQQILDSQFEWTRIENEDGAGGAHVPSLATNCYFQGYFNFDEARRKFRHQHSYFSNECSVIKSASLKVTDSHFYGGLTVVAPQTENKLVRCSVGNRFHIRNGNVHGGTVSISSANLNEIHFSSKVPMEFVVSDSRSNQLNLDSEGATVSLSRSVFRKCEIRCRYSKLNITETVCRDVIIRSSDSGDRVSSDSTVVSGLCRVVNSRAIKLRLAGVFEATQFEKFRARTATLANSQHGGSKFIDCNFVGSFDARAAQLGVSRFGGCLFNGPALFTDAVFGSEANFSPLVLDDEIIPTQFKTTADFSWRGDSDISSGYFDEVDFSSVIFGDGADFSNRVFRYRTNFNQSKWLGIPRFFNASLNVDTGFAGASFASPQLRVRRDREPRERRIALMESYERAFRELKLKMEANRARHSEDQFHRLEMVSRRLQGRAVPLSERAFSILYDVLCGYGRDFVRPAVCFVSLIVVMAIWYAIAPTISSGDEFHSRFDLSLWMSNSAPHAVASFGEALELSFSNAVRPFRTFGEGFERYLLALSGEEGESCELLVCQNFQGAPAALNKVLSAAQSALSIVFLFLFLLGLRRRFQISD